MTEPERALFTVATAVTVYGAVAGRERAQQVAKPLMVPALGVRVLRRWRRGQLPSRDARLLSAALAAATVGDVFMLRPDDDQRIVRGAASFAVAQLAYAALLYRRGARPSPVTLLPRLAVGAGFAVLLRRRAPAVAAPLSAYGLALNSMATLAAAPQSSRPVAAGGWAFTVSDGLIAIRRCILRDGPTRAAAEGVVLATYALAQHLLVDGLLDGPH